MGYVYFALILTLILTPMVRAVARRRGIMDAADDPIKIHKGPIPYMGGVAFAAAYAISAIMWLSSQSLWSVVTFTTLLSLLTVTGLGLVDDIKGLRAGSRLALQLGIGIVLWLVGFKIYTIPLGIISFVLTPIFVAGTINAVNMFDGLDGLAGGAALISGMAFSFAFHKLEALYLVPALLLVAVLVGFLVFNFEPAKIFMGDAGSYFLGAVLALLAMTMMREAWDFRSFVGAVFLVGMPIFDAVFTLTNRQLRGGSLTAGDRNHGYDLFHRKVGSVRYVVLTFYLLQITSVLIGLVFVLK